MRRITIAGALVTALIAGQSTAAGAQSELALQLTMATMQDLGTTLPKPKLRRLLVASDLDSYYWTPSPDGRWFSYVDWSTGNLARFDLVSEQSRALTKKGTWADSESFAEISAISPDGKQIAFAWCCEPGYQLRLIGSDGSGERVLWTAAEGAEVYVVPAAWSPSGDELLVYLVGQFGMEPDARRGTRAMIFSPETGASKEAWTFDGAPDEKTQYSPDGRFVAYSVAHGSPMAAADLYLRNLKSGQETVLVSSPGHESFLGWSADGQHVLFHSELDGSPSIWALPVSEGRRSGPPVLVRRDVPGLEPTGASAGKFFYTVVLQRRQVQTMAMEIASGRVLKASTPESELNGGTTGLPEWSPNGEYLAYVRFASTAWREKGSLAIRSASGNNLRHIPLPDLGGRVRSLTWGPNGKRVLVSGVGEGGRGTRWIDLKSGEAAPVPGLENEWVGSGRVAFTPDGKYVFLAGVSFENSKLFRLDLASGEMTTFFERPEVEGPWKNDLSGVALSPDRKTLAVAYSDAVCLLPVEGGAPRWIYEETRPPLEGGGLFILGVGISWTPDGRYLLATEGGSGPESRAPLLIPVDGGEARRIESAPSASGIRLHPDGRRLAFTAGQYKAELWVLEFPD